MNDKTFIVTAGPTFEKIDPVRFIGNHSSGKMGYAIAEELANQGAKVILISGPVSLSAHHQSITRIDVTSAEEMYNQTISRFNSTNGAIMCAAVADFTPVVVVDSKVKRGKENYSIELKPTKDIAASLGKIKQTNQLLVGFALETDNEIDHASNKLQKKNLDFIVLNSLRDNGAGFKHDTNLITIIDKDNNSQKFELKAKTEVAKDIVSRIIQFFDT